MLEGLLKGQTVLVVERRNDRYQRKFGRIYGVNLDVNAKQVRQSMARSFRRYSVDATLYSVESKAKDQNRGLWRDQNPTSPWEWRASKRSS